MSYNVPVRHLQGGSVLEVASSGTALISSGGSLQVASGGVFQVAAGGSVQNAGAQVLSGSVTVSGSLSVTGVLAAPAFTLGGTLGRWSYGTSALTSGVGTVATGLTRVFAANANTILGEAQSAGSASHVMLDLSLSGAGSVIYRLGSVGGGVWAANGTISWQAMGT